MAPINSKTLVSLLLLGTCFAAPLKVRQLAGEGAAADSILSDTDNASGYGTEDALDNTAQLISGVTGNSPGNTSGGGSSSPPPPPPPHKRQLAGEGAAADSILSDTDNASGYGTEDALDNSAQLISSVTGNSPGNTQGGGSSSPPPPPPPHKRQLDKISAGVQEVGNAAGVGSATAPITSAGESIDGTLTGDAANAGAQVGQAEVQTAESVGSSVPTHLRRRQLDKISAGVQEVANAAGVGSEAAPATSAGESIDGTLTGDAANAGAQVGQAEVATAEQVGSSVPTHV